MFLGIDIGSRFTKIVYIKKNKTYYETIDSIEFYKKIELFKKKFKNYSIVATGYGRYNLSVLNAEIIPEILAHSFGAVYSLNISNFIVLDIGGQDTKIINVENKVPIDFTTNDKCAASSGRFLENMAIILKIPLAKLINYYKNPIKINSTCAVFTESEVIGAISNGYSIEEIAAGINLALFNRIKPWLLKNKKKYLS